MDRPVTTGAGGIVKGYQRQRHMGTRRRRRAREKGRERGRGKEKL